MRLWWAPTPTQGAAPTVTIGGLLAQWDRVECDFQEHYGIDLSSGVLEHRSWRWFRVRLVGLLSTDSRTSRHIINQTTSAEG